jgi:hypothetical protein
VLPLSDVTDNDPRIQAIRCTSCNRLRPHPNDADPRTLWCFCGGRGFVPSTPFPDEEEWACTIYEKEIKERELWKYT